MTKVCSKCKGEKELKIFGKDKTRCKSCMSAKSTAYRLQYRDKYLESKKKYYNTHKEEEAAQKKEYYSRTKEERIKVAKAWQTDNKDRVKDYQNQYRKQIDPAYKIKCTLRTRINAALNGLNKSASTLDLLGCTIEEFRSHLESKFTEGMNWANHGKFGWHIDHIIPCASFDLSDPKQQKQCFHYTNLQPLWWLVNIKKSDNLVTI